jgi:hypothetical protein
VLFHAADSPKSDIVSGGVDDLNPGRTTPLSFHFFNSLAKNKLARLTITVAHFQKSGLYFKNFYSSKLAQRHSDQKIEIKLAQFLEIWPKL